MKVIDLLNKIANGEEVPEKFRYELFELDRTKSNDIRRYYVDKEGIFFFEQYSYDLNDEVEIIEEDKKIEKVDLPNYFEIIPDGHFNTEHIYNQCVKIHDNTIVLQNKINEIIDYLEENK